MPGALEGLVDAAVTRYHDWAHGNPIMLVHAATGPRAATLVLPSLPQHLWVSTHDVLWAVTAALGTAYRPREDPPPISADEAAACSPEDVTDLAVATADEHAIKFTERRLSPTGEATPLR